MGIDNPMYTGEGFKDNEPKTIGYCYVSNQEIMDYDDYYIEELRDGKQRLILAENIDEYVLMEYKDECIDGMELVKGDF